MGTDSLATAGLGLCCIFICVNLRDLWFELYVWWLRCGSFLTTDFTDGHR